MLEGESLWAGDQDALNAILMSEIPADAIALRPAHEQPDWLSEVELVGCQDADVPVPRWRDGDPALLARAKALGVERLAAGELETPTSSSSRGWCSADDVALRLEPHELPPWLRDDKPARAARLGLDTLWRARDSAERIARASAQRLPTPLRDPMLRFRDRLADRFSA